MAIILVSERGEAGEFMNLSTWAVKSTSAIKKKNIKIGTMPLAGLESGGSGIENRLTFVTSAQSIAQKQTYGEEDS
jgi:hypothetical protein